MKHIPKPLIITGPSGVGKSSFCKYLESKGWLHLEVDQHPKDGVDELNLRIEWDAFFNRGNPDLLVKELGRRLRESKSAGVVMSLPSGAIPSPSPLSASRDKLLIRVLYGDPRYCLESFVERERRTGRGLPPSHWDGNNSDVFKTLSTSPYHHLLVDVFEADGSRKSWETVLSTL